MPFARAPDHPKEASRSGVGIVGEAGSHISNVSHLCKQGSTHGGSVRKRLKGCERPLETSELRTIKESKHQLCEVSGKVIVRLTRRWSKRLRKSIKGNAIFTASSSRSKYGTRSSRTAGARAQVQHLISPERLAFGSAPLPRVAKKRPRHSLPFSLADLITRLRQPGHAPPCVMLALLLLPPPALPGEQPGVRTQGLRTARDWDPRKVLFLLVWSLFGCLFGFR